MPTYDYLCPVCGPFELFQSISEPPHEKCPRCHAENVRRLISANANIIFKGSGFYSTDNRKSEPSKSEASTPSPSPSAAAK